MKKLLLLVLLLPSLCSAQYYGSVGLQTRGFSYIAGRRITEKHRLKNFDFAIQYRRPFGPNYDPKTLGASVGYQIGDNIILTPAIACNALFYKDYTAYDADEHGRIRRITQVRPSYSIELAKSVGFGQSLRGSFSYKAVLLKKLPYHGVFIRCYF